MYIASSDKGSRAVIPQFHEDNKKEKTSTVMDNIHNSLYMHATVFMNIDFVGSWYDTECSKCLDSNASMMRDCKFDFQITWVSPSW